MSVFAQDLNKESECRDVLYWVYRDLTLKNLELSYYRAFYKFLYSVHHAHSKTLLKDPRNTYFAELRPRTPLFGQKKHKDPLFTYIKARGTLIG